MSGHRTWFVENESLHAIGVWTEKKPDLGEDADPLLVHQFSSNEGMLAVCDGAGGAGAGSAGRTEDGVERSHAWVGARLTRALVEDWFVGTDRVDGTLRDHIAHGLASVRPASRSKIRGTMNRELPSTLAALRYRVREKHVEWVSSWAGDSRCYLLLPATGLHQLSRDDTESSDALELLTSDPPMTNMVCADRPFRISEKHDEAELPCLLLCATDGFFGYVTTPAQFEHVLLRTLERAPTPKGWAETVAAEVIGYTGDDASLVVLALGFRDFDELRDAMRGRLEALEHALQPVLAVAEGDGEALKREREASWAAYRLDYESLMPEGEPR